MSSTKRHLITLSALATLPSWALAAPNILQPSATRSKETPKHLDQPYLDETNVLRQSKERVFDLKTGRLGNLRRMHIRAQNLTVIIRQGAENRVTRGSHSVAINPIKSRIGDGLNPAAQDLELTLANPAPPQGAWVLIEVCTLQDLYLISSENPDTQTMLWIDGVKLPWLRIMAHEQPVVLTQVDIGHLHLDRNGGQTQQPFVATGVVQSLFASAQTPGAQFYLHDLIVKKQTQVMPKNLYQFFSLNINSGLKAFYDSPIAGTNNAKGFEVEIKGEPSALLFSGPGRAIVKRLSRQTEKSASVTVQKVITKFAV